MQYPDMPGPIRFIKQSVLVALALNIILLRFSATATADDTHAATPPHGAAPHGLVVVLDSTAMTSPSWHRALKNPSVSGVALQIDWRDIEPVEGKPDWTKLDELFAAVQTSHEWVHLLVFPGFFSPTWALDGVKTESFAIQYGPGVGDVETLPMPWDTVYLGRWLAFVKQLSERYGKSPALRLVAADGPTSVSAEFTLPNSPSDLRKWQHDSYTPSRYIAAWRTVFQAFAADFPDQYISLSAGAGLEIDEDGRIDKAEHLNTRQAIVDEAMTVLGPRMALQLSDVHAGPGPHSTDSASEDQFVIGYSGRIVTGFQMRTSAERSSGVMGADGDPPSALRKSIDLAMQANSSGRHVDYLEIYEPDVLASDMRSTLQYGASLFTHTH